MRVYKNYNAHWFEIQKFYVQMHTGLNSKFRCKCTPDKQYLIWYTNVINCNEIHLKQI